MRVIALASAALIGILSTLPAPAQAAHRMHRHGSMTVRLANGKAITFRLMMMGGRMMAVAPANYLYSAGGSGR